MKRELQDIDKNWPKGPKDSAERLADYYGEPAEVTVMPERTRGEMSARCGEILVLFVAAVAGPVVLEPGMK
jgi:hypothetical protein